jgi:hypothetical protein
MIDSTFIDRITELAQEQVLEINGLSYSPQTLHLIAHPEPKPLQFSSLGGLVDLARGEFDGEEDELLAHIVDPFTVQLLGKLLPDTMQRRVFAVAKAPAISFMFGSYFEAEPFLIGLKTQFVQTEKTALITRLVGNLTDAKEVNQLDDGFSQKVVVKAGIDTADKKVVPNPIKLQPFRTFREVEQPESDFLLRLRQGGEVALFEADGGAWRLAAMASLLIWLKEHLPQTVTVLS